MASDIGRRTTTAPLPEAARSVAEQAEQTVEAKASTTMDDLSNTVEAIAHAIRRSGKDLRQEQPQLASAAEMAADQVDRAARYLHDRQPREVLGQIEEAARRQPAVLIAGGLAVGLLLGRFLRTAATGIEASGGYDRSYVGRSDSYGRTIGDPGFAARADQRRADAGDFDGTPTTRVGR
jgi:ElaB/YqjD/DUF883 family membrane-anchored ribosome-binding protein